MIEMDDRGVSEVLGYVLVFSLIITVIAAVYTGGIASLDSAQEAEQTKNVERAFDVLDHNLEDVHRRGAPARTTEIRISGGRLGFEEKTEIVVEREGTSENVSISPNPIVYDDGDGTQIVYEAGAVFRTDDGNSVMLSEPPFHLTDEHSTVTLVRTEHTGDGGDISGEATVLVRGQTLSGDRNATVPEEFHESGDVNVTVTSPRADAWERYFEDRSRDLSGANVYRSGDEVTLEYDPDTVDAPRVNIRMRIVR